MRSKKLLAASVLLLMPAGLAADVGVKVTVAGALRTLLAGIGEGTGHLFSSLGAPLLVMILLFAVGGMIAIVMDAVGKKVGG